MKPKVSMVTVITLVIAGIFLTATTFGAISAIRSLSSSGAISISPGLGVYSDIGCTISKTSLDWGSAVPGDTPTATIYVKNTGTGASLTLSLTATNWSPANANSYITVAWNAEATKLSPGQSIAATITLTVSPSITDITNFSVQINILGTA